ncbi:hypothetical protein [Sulfurihydrogenibium azorense]|uniref:hypothetical protein n=1 Tax=Sulfurihydrogenibium azorense TaxID=309806 RepID=UPI00240928A0|nr:hypothetical protein [Sulfurihydrogenibium azorense]MDM7274378.1 hypothetical protein [Sulfurihydrogenibium azorense]
MAVKDLISKIDLITKGFIVAIESVDSQKRVELFKTYYETLKVLEELQVSHYSKKKKLK